jgi:hypothetical protein
LSSISACIRRTDEVKGVNQYEAQDAQGRGHPPDLLPVLAVLAGVSN